MGDVFVKPGGGGADLDAVTAIPTDVLFNKVYVGADGEPVKGTLTYRGAWTGNAPMNGSVTVPWGYHSGAGQVNGPSITDRGAWDTVLGINGSVTIPEGYHNGGGRITQSIPTFGGQTISPSAGQQVAYCAGKYATENVTVSGVSNLSPANIKKGVTVGGVTGTFEGYVPTATDWYLRGNNIAGFTKMFGTVIFEEGMITVNNDAEISTSKEYDLSGFSRLNVECNATANVGTSPRLELYRGKKIGGRPFAQIALPSNGNQTLSLSFTGQSIRDYWTLRFPGMHVNIYRIWLS